MIKHKILKNNIDSPFIGRVKIKNKRYYIERRSNKIFSRIIEVINNSDKTYNNKKFIQLENLNVLRENDIVFVENNNLQKLFESDVDSNVLVITEQCNADCIMCPQHRNESDCFFKINSQIIDLINIKIDQIALSGGEPTVKKESLLKTIELLTKKFPEITIEILTNAVLLNKVDYVQDLMKVGNNRLIFNIPFYSDIEEIHNAIVGKDYYSKTIEGIYNLARFNQKIEIRNVIMQKNYKRLPEYVSFIYKNFPFIYHIALMGIEINEKAKQNFDEVWISPDIYSKYLEKAIISGYRRDMNISVYNHPLCILPENIRKFADKSISSWKVDYLKDCEKCSFYNRCGGFFHSNKEYISKFINCINVRENEN